MTPETSLSSKSGPRSRWNREDLIEEVRFAHDSPLEGDGFELPAPLRASSARWCVEQHRLVDSLWSFTIATSRVSENSDPQPRRPRRPSRTRVSCLGATTRF